MPLPVITNADIPAVESNAGSALFCGMKGKKSLAGWLYLITFAMLTKTRKAQQHRVHSRRDSDVERNGWTLQGRIRSIDAAVTLKLQT